MITSVIDAETFDAVDASSVYRMSSGDLEFKSFVKRRGGNVYCRNSIWHIDGYRDTYTMMSI